MLNQLKFQNLNKYPIYFPRIHKLKSISAVILAINTLLKMQVSNFFLIIPGTGQIHCNIYAVDFPAQRLLIRLGYYILSAEK